MRHINTWIDVRSGRTDRRHLVRHQRIKIERQPIPEMRNAIRKISLGDSLSGIVRGVVRVDVIRAKEITEGYWQAGATEHRSNAHTKLEIWSWLKADFFSMYEGLGNDVRADDAGIAGIGLACRNEARFPVMPRQLADKEFRAKGTQNAGKPGNFVSLDVVNLEHGKRGGIVAHKKRSRIPRSQPHALLSNRQ